MSASLTDEQLRGLEVIYGPFRDRGEWPEYQYVERVIFREMSLDAREFLPTFPVGLIYPEPSFGTFHVRGDQPLALTVAGVWRCDGSEDDVRLFIEALKLFVRLEAEYDMPPTGGEPPSAGSHELQAQLNFDENDVARTYQLFRTEIGLLGGGGGNPTNWRFELTPDIRRFAGLDSIEDYLERRVVPQPYRRAPVLEDGANANTRAYVGAGGRRYTVVESLFAGGFGSVAWVRTDDGDDFALKTLTIELEDYDALRREVDSLRLVEHENVIRYVDYGAEPEPFLVMELARDGSLADRLATARQQGANLPIETVLAWSDQMLRGLGAIHEVMIHRDLKPGNVLFGRDTLKIGDFGLARVIDASTGTHTFKGWGTPPYLPPEGWEGVEGRSPTPSYDLYSFGVMLFELLTLRLPFEGDRQALSRAHLYESPPSPRGIRADIPPQLDALILQLLHKDPSRRGSDATSVLQALAHIRAASASSAEGGTSDAPVDLALDRLRRGVSSLVQQESEAEARRRMAEEEQRKLVDAHLAGLNALGELIERAVEVVEANVAPLRLHWAREDRGKWAFQLPPSALQLRLNVRQVDSAIFSSDRRPGEVIGFGEIEVIAPQQPHGGGRTASDPRAGANVVIYIAADTPWVPRLQVIELENSGMVAHPMRDYQPFALTSSEIAEHGHWLWGGGVHIFQSRSYELTTDVLIEWLSRLVT